MQLPFGTLVLRITSFTEKFGFRLINVLAAALL